MALTHHHVCSVPVIGGEKISMSDLFNAIISFVFQRIAGMGVGKTIRQLRLQSRLKATQEGFNDSGGTDTLRRKNSSEFHQFIISPLQHVPDVYFSKLARSSHFS
jgi:hypothetical protein